MSLKNRITQAVTEKISAEKADLIEAKRALQTPMVTAEEQDWALRLHSKLVKIMDLSLIASMDENEARIQIRDVAHRLISEVDTMTLNAKSRQQVIKLIEDEILGLALWNHCYMTTPSRIFSLMGMIMSMWNAMVSWKKPRFASMTMPIY